MDQASSRWRTLDVKCFIIRESYVIAIETVFWTIPKKSPDGIGMRHFVLIESLFLTFWRRILMAARRGESDLYNPFFDVLKKISDGIVVRHILGSAQVGEGIVPTNSCF